MTFDRKQRLAFDMLMARHDPMRPARIGGYAGTGKTEVLARAVDAMEHGGKPAVVLTPTHRARRALADKGVEAQTIHSAIYAPVHTREPEIIKADIVAAEAALDRQQDEADEARLKRLLTRLREELETDVTFARLPGRPLDGARVIVDEASMVGGGLLADLQRSGLASLALVGDPAQLPPVNDTDPFNEAPQDVVLDHVYRNGGWILDACTAIREGRVRDAMLLAQNNGRLFLYNPRWLREGAAAYPESKDVVEIVWRNATRRARNAMILDEARKTGAGAVRIMAEDNWHGVGVQNGDAGWRFGPINGGAMFDPEGQWTIKFDTGAEAGPKRRQLAWAGDLSDRPTREELDGRNRIAGGSCVTCHKAQGGQWPTVILHDDFNPAVPGRLRWLYTAASRAQTDLHWFVARY